MALEKLHASFMRSTLDTYRDMRDAMMEAAFFQTFTSPVMKSAYTRGESDTAVDRPIDVHNLPEVRDALSHIGEGGLAAGAIRMMLLMNRARGYIRRSRLERALNIIKGSEPFKSMTPEDITQMIRRQTLIVDLEPKLAFSSLIQVLPSAQERQDALDLVMAVAGPRETMSARALVQYMRYEGLLKPANPVESASEGATDQADKPAPSPARKTASRKRTDQE